MGNDKTTISKRSLVIKPNMTVAGVQHSKQATPQQKMTAGIFDANGDGKYNQKEANAFNSTLITTHKKDGSISLWTRYANGQKKETRVAGDVMAYKHAPSAQVKPYVRMVHAKPTAAGKSVATQVVEDFVYRGKGKLTVETYPDGKIKSKEYNEGNGDKVTTFNYYQNGTPQSKTVSEWDGFDFVNTLEKEYYSNGKLKRSMVQDKELYKNVEEAFYKNGTPQSKTVREWNGSDFVNTLEKEYYPNGKLKRSMVQDKGLYKNVEEAFYENGTPQSKTVIEWNGNDFVNTLEKEYYPNGKLKRSMVQEKRGDKKLVETFHENGTPQSKTVSEWNGNDFVETTNIQYDRKGNVIKKANIQK